MKEVSRQHVDECDGTLVRPGGHLLAWRWLIFERIVFAPETQCEREEPVVLFVPRSFGSSRSCQRAIAREPSEAAKSAASIS